MSTWEVKLQHLRAYGEDRQADGRQFGRQADERVRELKAGVSGMAVDARFTEALALKAAADTAAGSLGTFTSDMAEGIQSYGRAAEISHEAYGGADITASEELEAVRRLLDDHTN